MPVLLGVDPGSLNLGYGVLDVRGGRFVHLAHGTIRASRSQPLHQRLALLYSGLVRVVDEHQPQAVAIERVFAARNVASALTLGQARGMILLLAGQRELGVAEYSAAEVKKAVTGNGRASKDQVAAMVRRILGRALEDAGADSTDALAVALCHATEARLRRAIERAERSGR